MRIQAAYNNNSEVELEAGDVCTAEEPAPSLYAIGTKVAKQFDGAAGELVWFEGVVQRYDDDDNLYWVLYSDGDSEDMTQCEVRDAVHDYKVHMQQQEEPVAEVVTTAATVCTDEATVPVPANKGVPAAAVAVADTNSVQSLGTLDASEIAVAMKAMTAAVEQLTSAAARIEAAV